MATISHKLSLPLIPRLEWLRRLESAAASAYTKEDRKRNPATRVLPTMRYIMSTPEREGFGAFEMPLASTFFTTRVSTTLANAPSLDRGDILRWIEGWQEMEFLDKGLIAHL